LDDKILEKRSWEAAGVNYVLQEFSLSSQNPPEQSFLHE